MGKANSARSGLTKKVLAIKENRWLERLMPIVILLVLVAFFSVMTQGRFSSTRNLKVVLDQSLVIATVATGASFIFATGNVNIAMGACTALTATIAAKLYLATESVAAMMVVAVLFGMVLLLLCAFLSTIFKVRVMFVTIVMMVLLANIKAEIMHGETITVPYAVTAALQKAYVPYIVFAAFFIFCFVIFHCTAVGRSIKSVGSNTVCSEQTGIFRNKWLTVAFVIAGIGVGLGAVLTIIRTGTITNNTASSMNMDCMLAIVLGGMPVYGGSRSRTYAAVIGAMTVAVLNNGLPMIGVDSMILQGVRGVLFLILVLAGSERPELLPARE